MYLLLESVIERFKLVDFLFFVDEMSIHCLPNGLLALFKYLILAVHFLLKFRH